jgi:regulator of replication initiation timing
MLPNIASARRLTKVLIVNKSIEHVRQQRDVCLAADLDMQELLAENRRLVSEVNAFRAQVGGPAVPHVQAKPMTEAMKQLAETKNHVFGTFAAGFGDKWVEKASKAQVKTGIEIHDIPTSNPHSASAPYTASMASPMNVQPGIETIAPIEPLSTVYSQPEIGLCSSFDTAAEAPLSSSFNPFTHHPDQLLPNESYTGGTIHADPASWFTGIDMSIPLGQFHSENGEMLSCI